MPGFEVKMDGFKELQDRLDQLKKTEARRLLNKSMLAGAEVFQEAVAEKTPERPDVPSGTALPPGALKHDIRIKRIRATDQASDYFAIGPGKYSARVMRWLEWGHRQVRGGYSKLLANGKTRGPGKEIDFVPPHPVMRPAFEESGARAVQAVRDKLRELVSQLGKKGVR